MSYQSLVTLKKFQTPRVPLTIINTHIGNDSRVSYSAQDTEPGTDVLYPLGQWSSGLFDHLVGVQSDLGYVVQEGE